MNYKKNYYDYINYVKTLNRNKNDGNYYEKHHIIPRSLGGDDSKDNLVLLTAREHFLAHYLLWKFNPCRQTAYAFRTMLYMANSNQNRTYKMVSSKVYQRLKIQYAEYVSLANKGNKSRLGKHLSEESKEKIAKAHRGKPLSEEHKLKCRMANLGRKHSEESRRKMSEHNKGKHHMSEKHKNKLRMMNIGRHPSEETRQRMSMSGKGRVFTNEHRLNLSKAAKKRIITEEQKKKQSETRKRLHIITRGSTGMHWYNNGIVQFSAFECPDGFVPGRLHYTLKNKRKPMSEITKMSISNSKKGIHWCNNGIISITARECPEGFVSGRLPLKRK